MAMGFTFTSCPAHAFPPAFFTLCGGSPCWFPHRVTHRLFLSVKPRGPLAVLVFFREAVDHCAVSQVSEERRFRVERSEVARWGCGALLNMALDSDQREETEDDSGIAIMSMAMQTHISDLEVQRCGCGALAVLAHHERHCKLMVEQGCAETVAEAMRQHCHDSEVQQFGARVMASLRGG
mmetsp:Transcript_30931/g.82108  ORF Transcript_30931/g.82108 Transcript_30931/m.82108 type:complete len:180 (-) Transcript_30931:419-958(-)